MSDGNVVSTMVFDESIAHQKRALFDIPTSSCFSFSFLCFIPLYRMCLSKWMEERKKER